jgi:hypothetical protein
MNSKKTNFNRRDESQKAAHKTSLYYWADKHHWTDEELLNPMIVPRSFAKRIIEARQELQRLENNE